ncbi:MAG: hypothetical protein M5R36_00030 [Deltaproteobacteria bacterium]|nr:hypothetical protein [Deltaproteobacteria bacterium]
MKPTTPRRAVLLHLAVIAAYAAGVVALLGPIPFDRAVWGSQSDVGDHFYLMTWQARETARGNPFPVENRELQFPDSGAIWLVDPVGGLFATPFYWLLGAPAAYNIMVAADLVFACWAMFWLVRRRTGDLAAAIASGWLFGVSPFMLANVHNGLTESLQAGWLPIFLGALLTLLDRAEEDAPWKRFILPAVATAAAWWIVTISGHWYHGIYAGVLFGLVTATRLARRPHVRTGAAASGSSGALFDPHRSGRFGLR